MTVTILFFIACLAVTAIALQRHQRLWVFATTSVGVAVLVMLLALYVMHRCDPITSTGYCPAVVPSILSLILAFFFLLVGLVLALVP